MAKRPARNDVKPIEALVVISDLHCGGSTALMPPTHTTLEGQAVKRNRVQDWIGSQWDLFRADVARRVEGKRWALLINGDMIEGVHHRTVQVISPDVADHVGCAIDILEPLAALADVVLCVRGTESHTGSAEEAIGRRLGARLCPETGRYAPDRWEFDLCGVPHVARHHIPATTRDWLRGMQLSATLASEQLSAAGAGRSIPRVVLCAHRHTAGVYRQSSVGVCVVTPPWQLLTRYGHKVVPHAASQPQVGGMILTYPAHGELPSVEELIYQPPTPASYVL